MKRNIRSNEWTVPVRNLYRLEKVRTFVWYNFTMKNLTYVDGQNLFMGTTKREPSWKVDLARFRVFLREKYDVDQAYYFLGYVQD